MAYYDEIKVNLFMTEAAEPATTKPDAAAIIDPTLPAVVSSPDANSSAQDNIKADDDAEDPTAADNDVPEPVFSMSEKEVVFETIDNLAKLRNYARTTKEILIANKSTVDRFQQKLATLNRIIDETTLKQKITNYENALDTNDYIKAELGVISSYLIDNNKSKSSKTPPK